MTLEGVRVDDIVRCEVRGAQFYALVRGREDSGLEICVIDRSGLPRGLEIRHVTARQVTGVWRKSQRKTAAQRRAERHHGDTTGVGA